MCVGERERESSIGSRERESARGKTEGVSEIERWREYVSKRRGWSVKETKRNHHSLYLFCIIFLTLMHEPKYLYRPSSVASPLGVSTCVTARTGWWTV